MSPNASTVVLVFSCTVGLLLSPGWAERLSAAEDFSSEKAGFSLRYRGETSPYRITAAVVLPGEDLRFEAVSSRRQDLFAMRAEEGSLRTTSPRGWVWTAPPEPGHYRLDVTRDGGPDRIAVNAFVLVPFAKVEGERLNGYRIGAYPSTPLRGLSIYRPPPGFVEVTRDNENTLVSPHFRLGQFLCKQDGGYPKYLVLRERLLLKLELLLETVNRKGVRADSLQVMSGYRTPFYNQAIGNVKYSRHVWGGAADVFVDVEPRDGVMDDLNGDGRLDVGDAAVLSGWVEELFGRPFYAPFIGGLARYKPTPAHGAFVHVDVRGTRARWGS